MPQTPPAAALRPPADPPPARPAPHGDADPRPLPPRRRALLLAGLLLAGGCAGAADPPASAPGAALPALEIRAAQAPGDVDAAVRLGDAYRRAGRLDDARQVLEAAHRLAPRDEGAALFLGLTAEDQGEMDRARQLYTEFLLAGASRRMQRELRGRLVLLERRVDEAAVRDAVAREARLAATPPRPNSVAVYPFRFAARDETLRPLERALAEFLSTDLAVTGRLAVLERARVQLLLDEIALGASGRVDPATAARGGRLLGAAHVVQGHIGGTEQALELGARVARVTPAGAEAAGSAMDERGGLPALFQMQKALALGIHERLGVRLTPPDSVRVLRRPTENLRAVLAYGRGLEAADAGDFAQAVRHFMEAARLDPGFAEARRKARAAAAAAHAALVPTAELARLAWMELGLDEGRLAGVQGFVPVPGTRDPVVEAVGREGFRDPGGGVELVFRRP